MPPFAKAELVQPPLDLLIIFTTPLLDQCRERNIKLNKKFTFNCDEVQFIGHLLTNEGLKPDPAKGKAIRSMSKASDVAAVQRLMGMLKYLSEFLVDLSQICEPIRRLTHKDVPWFWKKEQDIAFDKIKEGATSAPVLKHLDSSKSTEGRGDASSQGLGFVLTQEDPLSPMQGGLLHRLISVTYKSKRSSWLKCLA